MAVTLSPKQFMRKNLIEGIANAQMEDNLDFLPLFNTTYTDAVSVTYSEDLTTAGEDITNEVMGEPVQLGELSELPNVEVSAITQKAGMLRPFGVQFKISERAMRRDEVVNELIRATERVGFAMARKMNNDIGSKLTGVSNDLTEVAASTAWSEDAADPINDILRFKKAMRVNGFGSKLTDLYLNTDNYAELEQYMVGIDRNWGIDPRGEEEVPRIRGVSIHEILNTDVIDEGDVLGLDTRPAFKPLEIYAYRPEGFSTDNKFRMINVYQYKEDNFPRNTVVEFVAETLYALKKPNSVYYYNEAV